MAKKIVIPFSKIAGTVKLGTSYCASIFLRSLYKKEDRERDSKAIRIMKTIGIDVVSSTVTGLIVDDAIKTMANKDLDMEFTIGKKNPKSKPEKKEPEKAQKTPEEIEQERQESEDFFRSAAKCMEKIADKYPTLWDDLLKSIFIKVDPNDNDKASLEVKEDLINGENRKKLNEDNDIYEFMTFLACIICTEDDEESKLDDVINELRILTRGYVVSKGLNKGPERWNLLNLRNNLHAASKAAKNLIRGYERLVADGKLVPEEIAIITVKVTEDGKIAKQPCEREEAREFREAFNSLIDNYVPRETENRLNQSYDSAFNHLMEMIPGLLNDYGDLHDVVKNLELEVYKGVPHVKVGLPDWFQGQSDFWEFLDFITNTITLYHIMNDGDITIEFNMLKADLLNEISKHYDGGSNDEGAHN